MMYEVDVFKRTQDSWFPSYIVDDQFDPYLVSISFCTLDNEDGGGYLVSAWGADDMGLSRSFINESEAWIMFLEIIGLDYVNIKDLRDRGFTGS